MTKMLLVMLSLTALVASGCGSNDSGGSPDDRAAEDRRQQVEQAKEQQTPKGDMGTCLDDAGFTGTDEIVATVVIEGAEQIAVTQVPEREGEYAVVYQAASEQAAQEKAQGYQGGPFAEAVGDKIYTFTSGMPTEDQKRLFRECLVK